MRVLGYRHSIMTWKMAVVLLLPCSFSILGLGDVVLPGLLAALCYCWDAVIRPRPPLAGHFVWAVLAYISGLCLTYTALLFSWFGGSGQPALVWIVPVMLATVATSAWCRGDFPAMWHGWDMMEVLHHKHAPPQEAQPLLV